MDTDVGCLHGCAFLLPKPFFLHSTLGTARYPSTRPQCTPCCNSFLGSHRYIAHSSSSRSPTIKSEPPLSQVPITKPFLICGKNYLVVHNESLLSSKDTFAETMASMTTLASLPAVHAGLRTDVEKSFASSSSSSLQSLLAQRSAVTKSSRSVVARASHGQEEAPVWKVAKSAAAAAAISLVLNASPVQAADPNAFLSFPDNAAGEASRNILSSAKKNADESFAEAQKTGKETTGQAASAGQASPAISQVDPNAEEAANPMADAVAARADAAAELAPGTGRQNGKKGENPIVKAFATPTRGLGDKAGENDARYGNVAEKNKNKLPGTENSIGQNPGIIDNIYNTFKSAGEGRDQGVGTKPF